MGADIAVFIPMVLFVCIVVAIKIVVESRLRRRLAETHASDDLVKAMLLADEQNRRLSALKWGMVLVLVGISFGLIDAMNLRPDDPATFGLLIGAAGLGMLGYHLISQRQKS